MYNQSVVKIEVGKESELVDYLMGVQQGDNMAPVIFLFVMQAAIDSLATKLTETVEFRYHSTRKDPSKQHGKFTGQVTRTAGSILRVNNFLFIDDGAFVFATYDSAKQAAQIIVDHFQEFGLTVHTGDEASKSKSKTEAVFFPPSIKEALTLEDVPPNLSLSGGKHIPFTKNFRYLGSIITHDLTADMEVETRIKKASQQMGALSYLWNCKDADLLTKQWVYLAGPVNTLLWGSESLNLSARNIQKMQSFHHSAIRRILQLKWDQVKEDRITNEEVRERFYNIPDIEAFITRRTWRYIGKIYRDNDSLPKKLLGAWIYCPRKAGAPQLSCKSHFADTIERVMAGRCPNADFKHWAPTAMNEGLWEAEINNFFEESKTFVEYEEPTEQQENQSTTDESADVTNIAKP